VHLAKPGLGALLTRIQAPMQIWLHLNTARTQATPRALRGAGPVEKNETMGQLKQWRDQQWVRIGTDGKIKGACGTSKDKKNPDRCLPKRKALSLSKAQRATTARKKKSAGSRGKTVVANTKRARVRV